MKNNIIVVGIGHPMRGDDSLGPVAITKLPADLAVDTKMILGDVADLLEIFENYSTVFIIDAIYSKTAPAGFRYRLTQADLQGLASHCRTSTHAFDLAQTIQLAENLGILPSRLIIYGIEAQQFNEGEGLSQVVAAELEPLLADLTKDIHHART